MGWLRVAKAVGTGGFSEINPGKLKGFLTGRPSRLGPVEIPGLFDRTEGAGYARRAAGMAGSPIDAGLEGVLRDRLMAPGGGEESPFYSSLQEAILRPRFGPQTASEQALLDQVGGSVQARLNAMGIGGSPEGSRFASALAPTLVDLRERDIGNLFRGEGAYLDRRKQTFTEEDAKTGNILARLRQGLAGRGMDMDALLKAAGYGLPQVSQKSTGASKGFLDYVKVGYSPKEGFSGSIGGG